MNSAFNKMFLKEKRSKVWQYGKYTYHSVWFLLAYTLLTLSVVSMAKMKYINGPISKRPLYGMHFCLVWDLQDAPF